MSLAPLRLSDGMRAKVHDSRKSTTRVPGLDTLRAAAVAAVFGYHAEGEWTLTSASRGVVVLRRTGTGTSQEYTFITSEN